MVNLKVFRKQLTRAMDEFPDALAGNVGDAMERSRGVFLRNLQRDRLNFPASGAVFQCRGGVHPYRCVGVDERTKRHRRRSG